MYPLKHTFRILCSASPNEKISTHGDKKIIDTHVQQSDLNYWAIHKGKYKQWMIQKYTDENKLNELKSKSQKKIKTTHFNVNYTKWSPKDNVSRFIFSIAVLECLKFGENYSHVGLFKNIQDGYICGSSLWEK